MHTETLEYRPNTMLGLALAAVCSVTAAMLLWIGFVLGPDDVASMDGLNLILFTVVSIRLFSWAAAAVFAVLAIFLARRTLHAEATLTISPNGVTLPNMHQQHAILRQCHQSAANVVKAMETVANATSCEFAAGHTVWQGVEQ